MNVREDLINDMVNTLYKDEARIKQLEALVEAAYMEGFMACGEQYFCWSGSNAFKQLQALKE